MRIRSVSPLIATIILIALTVAIGAIIVGWGRSYVQKQVSCLGASVNIIKAKLDKQYNQVTVGFINNGNMQLDPIQVYGVLYTASGKMYKCPYVSGSTLPQKLPCGLFNPVDANGNPISSINLGNYTEYALIFNNNTILLNDLQFNAYVQIGYGTCEEISERYPIS